MSAILTVYLLVAALVLGFKLLKPFGSFLATVVVLPALPFLVANNIKATKPTMSKAIIVLYSLFYSILLFVAFAELFFSV